MGYTEKPRTHCAGLPSFLKSPSPDGEGSALRRLDRGWSRIHRHLHPLLGLVLELHEPIDVGVKRVVLGHEDVLAGMELGAALLDEDRAGRDLFAPEALDAQVLR